MRGKALPRAEDLKQKLIEKYARENEEKLVLSYGLFAHTHICFFLHHRN